MSDETRPPEDRERMIVSAAIPRLQIVFANNSHRDINEFCFRTFELKNRKTRLQTKEEMKKKFGKSPDHADSVAVLVDVGRRLGVEPGKASVAVESENNFAKAQNEVYDEDTRFNNQFEQTEELEFSDW